MFSVRSQPQAIWVAATTTFISRPLLLLGQHQGIGGGPGCPDLVTHAHRSAGGAGIVGDIGGDDDAAAVFDKHMAFVAIVSNLPDPAADLEPTLPRLSAIQADLPRSEGKTHPGGKGPGKRHRHSS